jgi:transposase
MRSKYNSLVGKRGKKKALIAIGHKILVAIFIILREKIEYKELSGKYLQKKKKSRKWKCLLKLHDLGLDVMLSTVNKEITA